MELITDIFCLFIGVYYRWIALNKKIFLITFHLGIKRKAKDFFKSAKWYRFIKNMGIIKIYPEKWIYVPNPYIFKNPRVRQKYKILIIILKKKDFFYSYFYNLQLKIGKEDLDNYIENLLSKPQTSPFTPVYGCNTSTKSENYYHFFFNSDIDNYNSLFSYFTSLYTKNVKELNHLLYFRAFYYGRNYRW